MRILYLTTFSIPYLLLKFLDALFTKQCHVRILQLSKIITLLFVIGAFVLKMDLLTRLIYIFFIYSSFVAFVAIFVMVKSCINSLEGAVLYLVSTLVFCTTYLLDLLQFNDLFSKHVNLIPFGLFIMLFGMSVTISRRFSRSFYHIEEQSDELKRLHRIKDKFLANTSHELKTPLNGIILQPNLLVHQLIQSPLMLFYHHHYLLSTLRVLLILIM